MMMMPTSGMPIKAMYKMIAGLSSRYAASGCRLPFLRQPRLRRRCLAMVAALTAAPLLSGCSARRRSGRRDRLPGRRHSRPLTVISHLLGHELVAAVLHRRHAGRGTDRPGEDLLPDIADLVLHRAAVRHADDHRGIGELADEVVGARWQGRRYRLAGRLPDGHAA